MKKTLTVALSLLSLAAFSQKNFKPGYIVLNSGDTVRGEIDYRNWEKNPESIEFRTGEVTPTIYSIADMRFFAVDNEDRYERAVIRRTTRPVDLELLRMHTTDSVITDTVLLRTLVSGELSLYQLNKEKNYFFLRERQGDYKELEYRIELIGDTYDFRTRELYRNLLKALPQVNSNSSLVRKADVLPYRGRDLAKFVRTINASQGGAEDNMVVTKKKLISFYAGTGVVFSSLSITDAGQHELAAIKTNAFRPSPTFQAGMNIKAERNLQRLSLRLEVSYSSFNFDGEGEKKLVFNRKSFATYELQVRNITPGLQVNYSLWKTENNEVFAGLGYQFNISKYPKHRYEATYSDDAEPTIKDPYVMQFEKTWSAFNGRVGARFARHFEASAYYVISGTFSDYRNINIAPNIIGLQLNYLF